MISLICNQHDDTLTIKTAQVILMMLNPKRYRANQAISDQVLAISLNMLSTKIPQTRQSILSTIQQLYHNIFESLSVLRSEKKALE